MRSRLRGSRPIGASTWRARAPCQRAVRERQVLALRPRAPRSRAPARPSPARLRATTIRPLVSLSSRCTMPARGSSAARGIARQQAVEQRAAPVARRRMHHQAGRLVDHQQVLVLVQHGQRHRLGPEGLALRRRPQLDRAPASPAWTVARRSGRRTRRRPRPCRRRSAAAGSCARTRAPAPPSARSSRWPCCAAPITKARSSLGGGELRAPRRRVGRLRGVRQGVGRYNRVGPVSRKPCRDVSRQIIGRPRAGCLCAAALRCWPAARRPTPTRPRTGARTGSTPKPRTKSSSGAYDKAVPLFEKLEGRAAGTPLAQQAQLDQAYAQYKARRQGARRWPRSTASSSCTRPARRSTTRSTCKGWSTSTTTSGCSRATDAPGPVRARPEGGQGILRVVQGTGRPASPSRATRPTRGCA